MRWLATQLFLDLHKVYLEVLQGSLGNFINKGNIKFIAKQEDPKLITNGRSIILLNFSYTIITKVITLHLQSINSIIVHSKKTYFIQNKYILHNIITYKKT